MITVLVCVFTFIVGHAVGYFWQGRKFRAKEFRHEHVWGNWEDCKINNANSGQRRWCMGCNFKEVREVF